MITSVICKNDTKALVEKLQQELNKGNTIGCLELVDCTEKQIVVLISDKNISKEMLEFWWSGYKAALE